MLATFFSLSLLEFQSENTCITSQSCIPWCGHLWLNSLPPGSVQNWEYLAQKFLTKYFPPSKTTKLRTEIVNFTQFDRESLYDAWERFKELLRALLYLAVKKRTI
ncbi:hypothetical protein L6164_026294 [Bauhinia variegata]|uniref:Uncharacterized protein n=1 Tax=Bauhinia variegata TaxID=167791 RepID=A0ACB9LPY5_BAUVA|nr:hypothetical protein L6164_026294 [Bauhinia variegata]